MDEGKKWMIISGGGGKAGGLKVDTNTGSNPFAGLQFARLYFDGNGGLAEGYFEGVVLKPAERREVEWSTPKVWFDTFLKKNGIDSDAMYERIRQKTMEHYKNFKGVYTQFWED